MQIGTKAIDTGIEGKSQNCGRMAAVYAQRSAAVRADNFGFSKDPPDDVVLLAERYCTVKTDVKTVPVVVYCSTHCTVVALNANTLAQ